MPLITETGKDVLIRPSDNHNLTLSTSLRGLLSGESEPDVIIHCRNKAKIKASKIVLAFSSKLLRSILSSDCQCPGNNCLH